MIAHAGGWDEMLIAVIVLAVVFAVAGRSRRRAARPTEVEGASCTFCGQELDPNSDRCPHCGFRTRIRNERAGAPERGLADDPRHERES